MKTAKRSIMQILKLITKIIEVILVLAIVVSIVLGIIGFVLKRKSDKQTKYHDEIKALETEVLNEFDDYVYFVAPRYNEDGSMVCNIFFRKDFIRNANNYSYSEIEVSDRIEEIILEYLETNEEDLESGSNIMLSRPQNYSFGRPNLCTVLWSIEIKDGTIFVNDCQAES